MQRLKLSEERTATSGRHPCSRSEANCMSRDAYAGPIRRPLPGRGIMSIRMFFDLDLAMMSTKARLGSFNASGSSGIMAFETLKKPEKRSLSANNQASVSCTAILNCMNIAGLGKSALRRFGAQSDGSSKSIITIQGANRAALLKPRNFFVR